MLCDFQVVADDRTGALESAAELVASGWGPLRVAAWPECRDAPVVDLGTRHLTAEQAASRSRCLAEGAPGVHKIDSALRGNWSAELVARSGRSGRPTLVIPALPTIGRTCVGGIVLEHGRPVHETVGGGDTRQHLTGSRPADLLRRADAAQVVELATADAVADWLSEPSGFAVADAASQEDIDRVVGAWAGSASVLVAGTSAAIRAVGGLVDRREPAAAAPRVSGPVLIACGSLHPRAHAQVDVARAHGAAVHVVGDQRPRISDIQSELVVVRPRPRTGQVRADEASEAAARLADEVAWYLSNVAVGALVVIGGDTAEAVIGGRDMMVTGMLEVGAAIVQVDGIACPVVTRPGAFGSETALVDLSDRLVNA